MSFPRPKRQLVRDPLIRGVLPAFNPVNDTAFAEEIIATAKNPPPMQPRTARRLFHILSIMMDPQQVDTHVCNIVTDAVFPDPRKLRADAA